MALHDIKIIGDSQQKDWRPFDKIHFTDGVNDFGYYGNTGAGLWSGQPIGNFFNLDKAFSASFWCKSIVSPFGVAFPLHVTPASPQSCYISDVGLRLGQGTNFMVLDNNFIQGIEKHIVITYDGSQSPNGVMLYVNSIELGSINQKLIVDFGSRTVQTWATNYYQRQSDNPVNFFTSNICDFRFFDNQILTSEEVRKLYHGNWETNLGGRTELIRLPMTLGSHYAINTPALLCSALDISGNNNHLIISGQGTTPTLNNFYP